MRFLTNRVGACRFAQVRVYFQGCGRAKDSSPHGKMGGAQCLLVTFHCGIRKLQEKHPTALNFLVFNAG